MLRKLLDVAYDDLQWFDISPKMYKKLKYLIVIYLINKLLRNDETNKFTH